VGNQIIWRLHVGWEVNEKRDRRLRLISPILARNTAEEQDWFQSITPGFTPDSRQGREHFCIHSKARRSLPESILIVQFLDSGRGRLFWRCGGRWRSQRCQARGEHAGEQVHKPARSTAVQIAVRVVLGDVQTEQVFVLGKFL
jgi:hypothetical protein